MKRRAAVRRGLAWAVVALLLGLGLVVLLVERGEAPSGALDGGPIEDASARARLHAAGRAADVSDGGPALRTDGRPGDEGSGRGPVTVRLLGPHGAPVPFACILAGPVGSVPSERTQVVTDASGTALFADVPQDGSWSVRGFTGLPPSLGSPQGADLSKRGAIGQPLHQGPAHGCVARVHGPDVVLRTWDAWRVLVSVVEADTGRTRTDARVRWRGDRSRPSLDWVAAPATFRFAWSRRAPWTVSLDHLEVEAPHGFVAWDPKAVQGRPCTAAATLLHVVPLRRSVEATLEPTSSDGAVTDAHCGSVLLGDQAVACSERVDGAGHLQIAGIPYLRGEPVAFWVHTGDLRLHGHVVTRLPPTIGSLATLSIPLLRRVVEDDLPVLPDGLVTRNLNWQDIYFDEDWQQVLGARSSPPAADEPVTEVKVWRRDGRPARGVWVEIASAAENGGDEVIQPYVVSGVRLRVPRTRWTGADGVVRFPRLAPGRYIVSAFQSGFVDARRVLVVPAGGTDRFAMHEGEGGTLSVEIVDREGHALPFARCHVAATSRRAYVDLHDGVQRMDTFTDERGRRIYRNVPPGPVRLDCAWGSRKERENVVVRAGERTALRIVMDPTVDKR